MRGGQLVWGSSTDRGAEGGMSGSVVVVDLDLECVEETPQSVRGEPAEVDGL
jgi:hypothetical protein